MTKIMTIKAKGSTISQLKEQLKLRLPKVKSKAMTDIAWHFMKNGVYRPISIDELAKKYDRKNPSIVALMSQLRNTHGIDIVNVSAGMYQLVGFTSKKQPTKSEMFEKINNEMNLINSVFC